MVPPEGAQTCWRWRPPPYKKVEWRHTWTTPNQTVLGVSLPPAASRAHPKPPRSPCLSPSRPPFAFAHPMATHGGENGSGHAAAEWRFARAAAAKDVAGADKMSIRAARFKISASVDARDPRPVLPLAHGDPSVFPAFRTAAEAEDAVAAALRTGKFNCYPAGVGLPDARRYVPHGLVRLLPQFHSIPPLVLSLSFLGQANSFRLPGHLCMLCNLNYLQQTSLFSTAQVQNCRVHRSYP